MRSIWKTKKKFEIRSEGQNLFSVIFYSEEDLEQILEGRPWLFRKYLVLFDRLVSSIDRDLIYLTSSPFWIKIGPCLPNFDKKDMLYAIGCTFGGVIRSEIDDEFCRLRVNLDVQKPLRRGIFASSGSSINSWVPFKYEKLPIFCFGCGHLGHGLQDCGLLSLDEKNKIKDDPPFSVALKAESKLVGKESMKFAAFSKLKGVQRVYTGRSKEGIEGCNSRVDSLINFEGLFSGRQLSTWEEGLLNEAVVEDMGQGVVRKLMEIDTKGHLKKSWRRLEARNKADSSMCGQVVGKRKFLEIGGDFNLDESSRQLNKQRMEKVRRRCGFDFGIEVEADGSKGGLCMAWKKELDVNLKSFSKWHIDVLIKEDNVEEEWRYTGFYGSPYLKDKNSVWSLLKRLAQEIDYPWLVKGDFNEILYSFEKCGGIPRDSKRMEDFREMLVDCQLYDIGFSGVSYTWERGNLPETNIRERLDKGLQMRSGVGSLGRRGERDDDEMAKLIDTKIHLNLEIDKDEVFWVQRARQDWLKLGDRNAAFFHRCALTRRQANTISKLVTEEGLEIDEESGILNAASLFFQNLFTTKGVADPGKVLVGIERIIRQKDNELLLAPYREEEIEIALKGMGPTKAPRPDGFPALFYQSSERFFPVRLITDNVLLAYEILHTIKQKRLGKKGVMAVKLDMSKAYDRVEWRFIEEVMIKIGFACEWVELLRRCVTSVNYVVNINGRRGDFEGLSSLIRIARRNGLIKGIKASRQGPAVSHLLFADDCIIFGEASHIGAKIMKGVLQDYKTCSGQCVNFSKSTVFFSPNSTEEIKAEVSRLLGVRVTTNPERYLGLPNMISRRKKESFQNLLDRISKRIDGWSNRMLSSSYAWRSIWAAKGSSDNKVVELINNQTREWKREVVEDTFEDDEAEKILRIPLAKHPHEDLRVWRADPTGVFSVKSTYKLLQNVYPSAYAIQIIYCDFYKKLWGIDLLTKIKINMYKASWNYIPTRVNLSLKKLNFDASCPRCGSGSESLLHLFRDCPTSVSMWSELTEMQLIQDPNIDFKQWLTSSVAFLSLDSSRLFCVALWAIWGERNAWIHEKRCKTGKEIADFVRNYVTEIDGAKSTVDNSPKIKRRWKHPPHHTVKINFDGAFDVKENRSASGVVVRNNEGSVLASKPKLHEKVASAFAAEALACREAVQLRVDMQKKDVIIEGDSLTVVKKCRNVSMDRSLIGSYIFDIQQMQSGFKTIQFEFISRSGNNLAHMIATESLKNREGFYLDLRVPIYAEERARDDSLRKPD
ncbi:reverse transcriptase [Gossypium australe]|uniref:Reverse transcriptase n=1 Tax=Gossypium australe TaxID=47621 RepID=A0A5B6UMM3_9ROSI|nr:reverse transcriptase [Gossypium australe]